MQPGILTARNNSAIGRKHQVCQNHRAIRFLGCILLAMVAARIAFAVRPPPSTAEVFAESIRYCLPQVQPPAIGLKIHLLPITIEPRFPGRDFRGAARAGGIICGWEAFNPSPFKPRVTKLPADPVLVLANGYLKCTSIRAALFDPQVSIADYPPGHFGDFEYAGLLVPAWIEFSDEATLQKIFQTLARLADGPDATDFAIYEMEDPELKLADYRSGSMFTPELLVEFVGGTNLRIELNFTQGRMLVQADDRWDFYHLNQPQAYLLRKIVMAESNKPSAM